MLDETSVTLRYRLQTKNNIKSYVVKVNSICFLITNNICLTSLNLIEIDQKSFKTQQLLTIILNFVGTHGVNWVTEDCGANLKALNSGKKIHELKFHPSQRSWALAAGWTSCEDFDDGEPCEIYKELYMTKDLGNSW